MADINVAEVEFCDVPGFPGYRVGDDGSVWSRKNGRSWKRLVGGVVKGYQLFVLSVDGVMHYRLGHHLVLEAFIGPRPDGMEACHHPDPCRTNNRLSNLRWDTRRANTEDKMNLGRQARGESNGCAKLTELQVVEMRQLAASGLDNPSLAAMFGCNYRTVSLIVLGKTWKHVGGPIRGVRKKRSKRHPGINLSELAARFGVTKSAIHYRLNRGWIPSERDVTPKESRRELSSTK